MRRLIIPALMLLAGCDFFTPPCTKVARKVCDIGSEGDACAFLLNVQKNDERAQHICNTIAVAAADLAADPQAESARTLWKAARTQLGQLGFNADPLKGRIETKLKEAGGVAGKVVESLEKNSQLAEDKVREAAEKALDMANK